LAKKSLFKKIFSGGDSAEKPIEKPVEKKQQKAPVLKLIFFIVDWHSANIVSDVCSEENVRFHFTNLGKGTASSEALDLLGIGSSEKAVIICLEQEIGVPLLMKEVRKKLKITDPERE